MTRCIKCYKEMELIGKHTFPIENERGNTILYKCGDCGIDTYVKETRQKGGIKI